MNLADNVIKSAEQLKELGEQVVKEETSLIDTFQTAVTETKKDLLRNETISSILNKADPQDLILITNKNLYYTNKDLLRNEAIPSILNKADPQDLILIANKNLYYINAEGLSNTEKAKIKIKGIKIETQVLLKDILMTYDPDKKPPPDTIKLDDQKNIAAAIEYNAGIELIKDYLNELTTNIDPNNSQAIDICFKSIELNSFLNSFATNLIKKERAIEILKKENCRPDIAKRLFDLTSSKNPYVADMAVNILKGTTDENTLAKIKPLLDPEKEDSYKRININPVLLKLADSFEESEKTEIAKKWLKLPSSKPIYEGFIYAIQLIPKDDPELPNLLSKGIISGKAFMRTAYCRETTSLSTDLLKFACTIDVDSLLKAEKDINISNLVLESGFSRITQYFKAVYYGFKHSRNKFYFISSILNTDYRELNLRRVAATLILGNQDEKLLHTLSKRMGKDRFSITPIFQSCNFLGLSYQQRDMLINKRFEEFKNSYYQ